jgi:hypothetical protein
MGSVDGADSTSVGVSQNRAPASESESVGEEIEQRQRAHLTRHYEFGHGLSEQEAGDLVNAALKYLCLQESVQPLH